MRQLTGFIFNLRLFLYLDILFSGILGYHVLRSNLCAVDLVSSSLSKENRSMLSIDSL